MSESNLTRAEAASFGMDAAAHLRVKARTKILGVGILILLLFGQACFANAGQYKMKEVGFRVLYMAPVFVAIDRGFFAAHGIDFTFQEIDSGALGVAAILSGDAQVTDSDIGSVASVKMQGKSLMMIYNLVDRVTLDLIVRNEVLKNSGIDLKAPPFQRAKVLKGLKIGITRPGAPTDIYARYFLIEAGLNPDRDATLVQIGGVQALGTALHSGRIDAFFLSPPLPQMLEREGVGTIVIRNTAGDVPELTDTNFDSLVTTAEYASGNGAALNGYTHAIQDAVKWIHGNRAAALKLLGDKWFKDTTPDALAVSFDALMPSVSESGRYTQAGIQKLLDVYKTIGQDISVDLTEGGVWTNEFTK
jgi:ABC-type nitrate/sulfonate/bicarbonate transport system substrate-binding protein